MIAALAVRPEVAWTLVLVVLGAVMVAAMFVVLVGGHGPLRHVLGLAGVVIVALVGMGVLVSSPQVVATTAYVSGPIDIHCGGTAVHAAFAAQGPVLTESDTRCQSRGRVTVGAVLIGATVSNGLIAVLCARRGRGAYWPRKPSTSTSPV